MYKSPKDKSLNLLINTISKGGGPKTRRKLFKSPSFMTLLVFSSLLILVPLIYYFYLLQEAKKLDQEIFQLKKELAAQQDKRVLYMNVAIRLENLKKITQQKYHPDKVIHFLDILVSPEGAINSYLLNTKGELRLTLTAPNLESGAKIWFYLVSNKKVVQDLNLKSFSITEDNLTRFTLQGKLNLISIYKLYGVENATTP